MTRWQAAVPLVLPRRDWPEQDRALFEAGRQGGDILEGAAYADGLRPTTLRNSTRGYGRFLAVLRDRNPDSLALPVADRITPARMRLYLQALLDHDNTHNTVSARFMELRSALRIMYPDRDFGWLVRPGGASLRRLLTIRRKPVRFLDIGELASWGRDLMDEGLRRPGQKGLVLFRNGLLIAVLADRAPRQRSLAELRIGHSIQRVERGYTLSFTAADTKAKRQLGYGLHSSLTPCVKHYLDAVRPQLLQGQVHNWFWVGIGGERLDAIGIAGMMRRASKARFGSLVGTHDFRRALATAAMIANPRTPALAAAILGNSPVVAEKHYVVGGQVEAAGILHGLLSEMRKENGR